MDAGFDTRLFDDLNVAVVTTDPDGLITGWNRSAERVFGWTTRDALGRSVVELVVPPDYAALGAEIVGKLKAGESWEGEFEVVRKGGERVHVYTAESPVRDAAGKVIGGIGISLDVTDSKRQQEELRRIQDLYRLVVENSQDLISISDLRGRVGFASPSFRTVLGYEPDELVGTSFFDILHPDDKERARTAATEAMAEGRGWLSSVRLRHKDGHWVELEGSGAAIRDTAGKPEYVLSAARDVTARRRADEAVRYAAAVVDTTEDAVIGKTLDGTIASWNRAAEQMYGYSAEEAVGRSIAILVPPEGPDDVADILERLRRGERLDNYETVRMRKDGKRIHVSVTISAILDHRGVPVGASVIARDISDKRHLEEERTGLLERERGARGIAEAAEQRLTFLLRASTVLGSTLDRQATLASLARLAVDSLGDVCVIDLLRDGEIHRSAAVARDHSKQPVADRLLAYAPDPASEHPVARVMRTRRPEFEAEMTEELGATLSRDEKAAELFRELRPQSYMIVPLLARDRVLGAISVTSTDVSRRYGEADVQLLTDLARRAALAIDNASLYAETERAIALREESIALLDTLLATAPVGLGFVDRDLRYVRINDSLAAMTAATPETHLGRTIREVLPELADRIEPLHRKVLETGEPVLDVEIANPGAGGVVGHWLSSYYPVRSADGSVIGVGVVVVDVTEQKRIEEELRAARTDLTAQLEDVTKLLQLSGRLSASLELQPVLEEVLAALIEVQEADAGVLRLYDPDTDELYIAASVNMNDEYLAELERVPAGAGVWAKAFAERRPFVSEDVETDPEFASFLDAARRAGYRAVYTSPLITRRDDLIGTIATHFYSPRRPDERESRLIELYAFEASDVIDNARLYREVQESREHLEFLAEASRILSTSLDYGRTLQQVARLIVPRLADWCSVDIREEDGSIRQVALAHVNPDKIKWARELQQKYPPDPNAPTGAPNVIRTGRSEIYPDIPQEMIDEAVGDDQDLRQIIDEIGFSSLMVVPLTARGRTLGALTFVGAESGRHYGPADLSFAEDLARRAAQAVDNARLFTQQRHIARTLQESLLPPQLPEIPGIEIAARYQAAGLGTDVGGDFYDLFETGAGEWGIVMGDVCGKGPEAAAVTGLARYTIRAAAMRERSPAAILGVLNEAIRQQREDLRFATVAYMRMERHNGHTSLEVACGGHPLPLIVRRDGTVEAVGRPGTLLGIFEDAELADDASVLGPGDAVILYTDGLSQERAGAGPITEEELTSLLGANVGGDADELADRLLQSAVMGGEQEGRDDVAVLVLRVQP